jgi:hypothetical protein
MSETNRSRFPRTALVIPLLCLLAGAAFADDFCGDIQGDDDVDKADLGILLADFGCSGDDCIGDVDGDGDTDQQDLAWLLINLWCPLQVDCLACEPRGTGTIDLDLVEVDNTSVGAGDDSYEPDFDGGVTHFTFDLVAIVTADNDWTTLSSRVELQSDEVEFFDHVFGPDSEPNSALFGVAPALEFDSFYASPPALFDADNPTFAWGPTWSDTGASAIWFDYDRYEDLVFTTERLTLILAEGSVPAAILDDCSHEYAVLARIATSVTSAATGAGSLDRSFLIVNLAQPSCAGDVDMDGDVDQSDLGILLASFGRPTDDPLFDRNADFDCDGDVDQSDLGTLLAAYGGDC